MTRDRPGSRSMPAVPVAARRPELAATWRTAAAKAIDYWLKLDKELKVISLSQDYMNLDAIQGADVAKAFRAAEQAGVTIVIGAGNNGEVHDQRGRGGWLKPFSNVITVGALNPKGTDYLEWRTSGGSLSSARGEAVDARRGISTWCTSGKVPPN